MAKRQKEYMPRFIERIADDIIQRKDVKYDAETHIPMLLKLFSEGKPLVAFLIEANVSKQHFYQWMDKHPELDDAYGKAKMLAEYYWVVKGECEAQSIGFNFQHWQTIMKLRFGYASTRKIKIKGFAEAKELMEKHGMLCKEGTNGHLTIAEANQLGALLLAGAKLEEHSVVKKDLERVKTQLGITD